MNILVTGAAGLLGGAIVAELLRHGQGVVALVHRQADIRGNDGVAVPTTPFSGRAPLAGQALLLHGDIRNSNLGLDELMRAALGRSIDLVIHCAALVQFEADGVDLEAVNVNGTRNVVTLFPDARFVHVSTAYVCGLRDGTISETYCSPYASFGNSYEQSKARAEATVYEMRPDAMIVRPSIIIGEHATGRIRSFDTIFRAFKFIAEGKITSVPVAVKATLNFVPIDHVVAGIRDLADHRGSQGEIFHLASLNSVSAGHFLSLIGRVAGLQSPKIVRPGDVASELPGIATRLAQSYWGYFQRYPEFETGALAARTGRAAPVMDDAALIRQIEYCVAASFIRPRVSVHRDNALRAALAHPAPTSCRP